MLDAWAIRWGIPAAALDELRQLATDLPGSAPAGHTEAAVQQRVRIEAAGAGVLLWRNNVGALLDERGRMVRYGLANDSKALNERIKSSDLIGLRPVLIGPQHVGRVLGQFVARECKAAGWRWRGTDRERAQLAFMQAVLIHGGDACFAAGPGTIIDTRANSALPSRN